MVYLWKNASGKVAALSHDIQMAQFVLQDFVGGHGYYENALGR